MFRTAHSTILISSLVMLGLAGCGDDDARPPTDGGSVPMDSGGVRTDAGPPGDGGARADGGVDAGAAAAVGGGADCASATMCDTCTPMGPCGWCGDTNTCMNGSGSGPTTGTCTDWRWVTSECTMPIDCSTGTDCASCAALGRCGWCPGTSTCSRGNADGPSTGTCAADWRYGSGSCIDCTVATTCGDCTAMSVCGWCGATGACARGTTDGPMMGTCASAWAWLGSECPGAGVDAGM